MINKVLSIPLYPYDDKGCCISCGYTYCDTLLECVRPWEVECPKLINPFIDPKGASVERALIILS
tara:strand:+ start:1397 stop:1591 length:195 start_codon:yes stop_codon:yes gene_type:complete